MKSYAVLLRERNATIAQRIRDAYDDDERFELSSTVFFVADSAMTRDVARKVGLKGADRVPNASGLVTRVSTYSGWTVSSLWEWLGDVAEAE